MDSSVENVEEKLSSSLSSSFKSPGSSPTHGEEVRPKSPAFSLAADNSPRNDGGGVGGPGGDLPSVSNSSGPVSGARSHAAAAARRGSTASVSSSAAMGGPHMRTRTAPVSSVPVDKSALSNGSPVRIGESAFSTTPPAARQRAEPLTRQHFDANDTSGFGSNAQTLTRSDTAPANSRDVFSSASAAVKHQQSPQQLQQHVQAGLWAEGLARRYFVCPVCLKLLSDAVLYIPDHKICCRACVPAGRPRAAVVELPHPLLEAIKEIYEVGKLHRAGERSASEKRDGARSSSVLSEALARQLADDERDGRAKVASTEATERVRVDRLMRGQAPTVSSGSSARGAAGRGAGARSNSGRPSGPTSRQYKVEADQKYESADYTAALELYSKAIQLQPQDGQTQLRFLYGNRSAAHFMAQRYAECVEDCLQVVKLEPGSVKMISRAARSAATMGDLKRAITILEATPADRMTDGMQAELGKYKTGLDIYQKAESSFGTEEGDERYRMLVAQFSETAQFRIRFAESLCRRRLYLRAVETLEVTSSSTRQPKLSRLLAFCLYQSGFERFDHARKVLRDSAQLDEDCASLLKLINLVDDGKQRGNANFTEKKFAAAVEHYTAAINNASDNEQILRILYCNRAAANKELGRYREGVDDCTKAIALDKDFFKAYARRARCHQNLGDYFAAVQDFRRATQYDGSDKELAKELRQAEYHLSKEAEREKDFYFQLGVSRTATDKEIKKQYRELSLRWHPDKCQSQEPTERERAEHKFKVISEAHATLIDPVKRREYDAKIDRERFTGRGNFGGFASTYSNFNPTENFRGRARGAPGGYW